MTELEEVRCHPKRSHSQSHRERRSRRTCILRLGERCSAQSPQLQLNATQTPAAVPLAPETLKSTKFPAAIATLPVATHEDPEATEHPSPVSAIPPDVPCRNITLIVFDCRENTLNCEAVHPAGTHVNTESASLAEEFPPLTE